jgi:two-component sensor histidine kinase
VLDPNELLVMQPRGVSPGIPTERIGVMTEFVLSPSDDHLLLRELAHRVNNEFTSIINSISRAAARSPNPEAKAVLNEAVEMLHDYVDVHRALKMPKPDTQVNAAEYLDQLCRVMSRSKLEQAGIDLVFDSAPVTLGSERSWYLGLIVYELVTNTARHSRAGHGGEVRVSLQCTGELVGCKVEDNGSGSSSFRQGQGLTIVARLANRLGGIVRHRSEPNGWMSVLVFPISPRTAQSRAGGNERAQLRLAVADEPSGSKLAPPCSSKVAMLPDIHDRDGWLRWSVEAYRSAKARD